MAAEKGACRKRKWSKTGSLSLLWMHTERILCQNHCAKYDCLCRDWGCMLPKTGCCTWVWTDAGCTWDESVSSCAVDDSLNRPKFQIDCNVGNSTDCNFCFRLRHRFPPVHDQTCQMLSGHQFLLRDVSVVLRNSKWFLQIIIFMGYFAVLFSNLWHAFGAAKVIVWFFAQTTRCVLPWVLHRRLPSDRMYLCF